MRARHRPDLRVWASLRDVAHRHNGNPREKVVAAVKPGWPLLAHLPSGLHAGVLFCTGGGLGDVHMPGAVPTGRGALAWLPAGCLVGGKLAWSSRLAAIQAAPKENTATASSRYSRGQLRPTP